MPENYGFTAEELRKFSAPGPVIAGAMGTTVELWAESEMGVVLKTWAGRTAVATQKQVDLRTRVRTIRGLDLTGGKNNREADVTVSAGLRGPFGRVWLRKKDGHGWRRTHNAGFAPINQHYKKKQWIDLVETIGTVQRALQRAIPAARAAIGLGRQSIVQIADSLGIRLESVKGGGNLSGAGIAKARRAIASTGKAYRNGFGTRTRNAFGAVLEAINRYPKALQTRMDQSLAGVIAGRMKDNQRNLEEGVFLSAAHTARAYPYLAVLKNGS